MDIGPTTNRFLSQLEYSWDNHNVRETTKRFVGQPWDRWDHGCMGPMGPRDRWARNQCDHETYGTIGRRRSINLESFNCWWECQALRLIAQLSSEKHPRSLTWLPEVLQHAVTLSFDLRHVLFQNYSIPHKTPRRKSAGKPCET